MSREPETQQALDSLVGDASVFENVPLYRERFSLYTTTDVLNDPVRRRTLVDFVRALPAASDTYEGKLSYCQGRVRRV